MGSLFVVPAVRAPVRYTDFCEPADIKPPRWFPVPSPTEVSSPLSSLSRPRPAGDDGLANGMTPSTQRSEEEGEDSERTRVPALILGLGIDLYGKERRIIRMVSRMRRLAPHFLLSCWDRGEVPAELTRYGLSWQKAPFGYLGFAHPWWTILNIAHMPKLFWQLHRAHREHRARVVVFASALTVLSALPVFLLWKLTGAARFVFYLGDIGGGTAVQRWVLRLADRMADCMIVNSQAVETGLRRVGVRHAPMSVVYNGVDIAHFDNARPVERSRWPGWSDEHFVIGYVGQLKERKGIADFLEAARLMAARTPDARFLVIGDCPQRSGYPDELKQRFGDLAECVVYLGFVDDVAPYYRAMDVLVVPSRYVDPAPNVNLEAMASGLPVVATDIGGNRELNVDGETGFLVPVNAPERIAECLLRLHEDPALRMRMGQAGRDRCRQLFDVTTNARTVESLILATLDGRQGGVP